MLSLSADQHFTVPRSAIAGVQAVHSHLKTELNMVMRLAGTPNIKAITRAFVSRAEGEAA